MMAVGDHGRENNAFEYDGPPQYNQTSTPQSNPNKQSLPGQYTQPQIFDQTRVPLYHTAPYTNNVNEFTPGANQPAITKSMQPPSECGYQTSHVVPELFQLGAHGYAELCLIAWCCTSPISGYILAKRMHDSHPCYKERSPI